MTIRYKIATLFSLTFTVVIGLSSVFIYFFFANNLRDHFRERLRDRVYIAAGMNLEKDELSASNYQRLTRQYLRSLPREEEHFFEVVNGKISASRDHHLFNEVAFKKSFIEGYAFYTHGEKQVVSIYYEDNQGNYIVVLAAPDLEGAAQLAYLQKVLILVVLGSLLLIAGISILFATQILKPLKDMITRVENISANNLQLRLQTGNGRDEISRLAQTFNNMLDRIETSFDTQRTFIHNASHELRTPLTVILGEAEYSLQKKDRTDHTPALHKISTEARHLQDLFKSLLQLSEMQAHQSETGFKPFRLDELVHSSTIEILSSEPAKNISIDYQDPNDLSATSFEITGNELWIKIAFSNILKNAIKYSNDKKIQILLTHSGKFCQVEVIDEGIGIPVQEQARVFSPFYRGKNVQSRKGYGIGLTLAHTIVKLHQGELEISSKEHEGTRVSMKFPRTGL